MVIYWLGVACRGLGAQCQRWSWRCRRKKKQRAGLSVFHNREKKWLWYLHWGKHRWVLASIYQKVILFTEKINLSFMKAFWHLQPLWQNILLQWTWAIKPRGKSGIHFCRCYRQGAGGPQCCGHMLCSMGRSIWVLPQVPVAVLPMVAGCSV